ncbi:SDR family NAD(P)-dependent oxidoreductase [Paenibacillus mendelii]|uniref:SDR family NAD(P)-dependent oxidoreductase n=1 Tax=Paenibacillus mendelii TaxID=206163 RepID=A0ABV6JI90_9BACL|nr:3-oxoacyl-ACP reductase family protein [Paenibacillus mendelii]MCQ6557430.1 3-oxoacyl-ACP reductase FabG [Paenibacillus mendelii]
MPAVLNGKVAIVTGAGRGIGKQIALHLAQSGAHVIVNYANSKQGAQEIVEQIKQAGGQAEAIQADVSKVEAITDMIRQTVELYGRIDILVNNAAIDPMNDFFDVTEAIWDSILDTNLKGTFFCSQACAKEMVKVGGGKIINISSVHGSLTMPRYAAYASTKGGINALTRQLALDLSQYNINVNAVAPGATEVEKFSLTDPTHDKDRIGKQIPLGRIGYPQDVAPIVAFLASEESAFITGQVITVDGGSSTRFFLQ